MRYTQLRHFVSFFLLVATSAVHGTEGEGEARFSGLLDVYAQNRSEGIPNFVTADLLVVGYTLVRQQTLDDVEREVYKPLLRQIIAGLAKEISQEPDEKATRSNRDFMAVLAALAEGRSEVHDAADSVRAQAELEAVLSAEGIQSSSLWQRSLDYSQFAPRGRYASDPELAAYFRSMRYAGSVLFAVRESEATGIDGGLADRLLDQATQLAKYLRVDSALGNTYRKLDAALAWQFGPSEDLTVDDLANAAEQAKKSSEQIRRYLLDVARHEGRQPRIADMAVDRSRLEPGLSIPDVVTGWRFLPSRYRADSAAFQALVYDSTGRHTGGSNEQETPFGLTTIDGMPVKGFPLADELLALLGSERARTRLETNGETQFDGYAAAFILAQPVLDEASGLEALHYKLLRAWLGLLPQDKQNPLESQRAFWTLQRHVDVLYAKQSYTAVGKGLSAMTSRQGAVLEAATPVYQVLVEIVSEHQKRNPSPSWDQFGQLVARIVEIDNARAQGRALDEEDQAFLNRIDSAMRAITGDTDRPVVVDVHTNPASGEVLEEATAWPRVVHARQGPDTSLARGARLSHREFKQPIDQRLTDEAWRKQLAGGI